MGIFAKQLATALCVCLFLLGAGTPLVASASASYAEHTPGHRLMAEAARFHKSGWYSSARGRYLAAAWWADKMAQFNVGVMYLHGQGVEHDPARGLAWLMLAAERGYPDMVAAVDQLVEILEPDQLQQARDIFENELEPDYGDKVAIERTAARMERERRRATGSRTGFIGSLTVIDSSGRSRSGDEYYAPEKWDFRHIVALETRLFEVLAGSTVTLGEFKVHEEDE